MREILGPGRRNASRPSARRSVSSSTGPRRRTPSSSPPSSAGWRSGPRPRRGAATISWRSSRSSGPSWPPTRPKRGALRARCSATSRTCRPPRRSSRSSTGAVRPSNGTAVRRTSSWTARDRTKRSGSATQRTGTSWSKDRPVDRAPGGIGPASRAPGWARRGAPRARRAPGSYTLGTRGSGARPGGPVGRGGPSGRRGRGPLPRPRGAGASELRGCRVGRGPDTAAGGRTSEGAARADPAVDTRDQSGPRRRPGPGGEPPRRDLAARAHRVGERASCGQRGSVRGAIRRSTQANSRPTSRR